MRYYVYALIDPTNGNNPFYIGKGIDFRIKSHFKEAESAEKGNTLEETSEFDISIIAENEVHEYSNYNSESPKVRKLRELFKQGYGYEDIARVLAKDLDEPLAFAFEAFLIKTVYGINNLTNLIEGAHAERFRPHDNWECLEGFDVSKAVNKRVRQGRFDKLQQMLMERLDEPLIEIQKAFHYLNFEKPNILDSGELGIEANVRGTRIKIFTRKKNIQIELRGRKKEQHQWIRDHFSKLNAVELLRNDNVFIPSLWKGSRNMTCNVLVAIKRVKTLLEIVDTNDRSGLSEEALRLLE